MFGRHYDDYVELMLDISRRGARTPWIDFFLKGVAEESAATIERIRRLQGLLADFQARVGKTRVSGLLLRLIDGLFQAPVTTIPRAAKLLGVSYHSAENHVSRLVEAKILVPFAQKTRPKVFLADEILQMIRD